jgi:hypothetical protein
MDSESMDGGGGGGGGGGGVQVLGPGLLAVPVGLAQCWLS